MGVVNLQSTLKYSPGAECGSETTSKRELPRHPLINQQLHASLAHWHLHNIYLMSLNIDFAF